MIIIDTNVAIHLRDGQPDILDRVERLGPGTSLSVISAFELEAGVHADPRSVARRRAALDEILAFLPIVPLRADAVSIYGEFVRLRGYSRRLVLDRMIAAQAVALGARVITIDASGFKGLPLLDLELWDEPL